MSELIPCPFCGKDDWYFEQGTEGETEIVCDRCEYRSQTFQTIEDAIKWWETRPIEDKLNKRIAELERDFDMLFRSSANKQPRKNTQTLTFEYGMESEE